MPHTHEALPNVAAAPLEKLAALNRDLYRTERD